MEEYLSSFGYGVSEAGDDVCLPILQHLSKYPWIYLRPEEECYAEFEIEWGYMMDKISGDKIDFLSELWRAMDGSAKQLLPVRSKFFSKSYNNGLVSWTPEGGAKIVQQVSVEKDGTVKSTNSDIDLFTQTEKNKSDEEPKIPTAWILEIHGEFKLITELEQLYPNSQKFAAKLLEQVDEFKLIATEVNERNIFENVDSILSGAERLSSVDPLVKAAAERTNFRQIWQEIFPKASEEHFIIRKLNQLESRLSASEAEQLRIQLVQAYANELYFPMRQMVDKEKEDQDLQALDAQQAEDRLRRQAEANKAEIAKMEAEMGQLKLKLEQEGEKLKNLKSVQGKDAATVKALAELQAKLGKMKEQQAMTDFLLMLLNPDPKEVVHICNTVVKSDLEGMTLDQLVKKLSVLYKVNKQTAEFQTLLRQASHNNAADKQLILQKLEPLTTLL